MNIEQMAEIKGYLCGFICSGAQSEGKIWLETLEGGLRGLDIAAQREVLIDLYKQVSTDFVQEELGFAETMFEKSIPLGTRASMFRKWCHGFLAGIQQTGLPGRQYAIIPSELREKIEYFEGFSKLEIDKIETSDADEVMFSQVTKLLEMTVLQIYRVLHRISPAKH